MAKVLITGATGYIGKRLLQKLLEEGLVPYCCVRNKTRFQKAIRNHQLDVLEVDFLNPEPDFSLPEEVDVAFYLIHSMTSDGDFSSLETQSAQYFMQLIERTKCRHIIYLSGIVNQQNLSTHLQSRFEVEKILRSGKIPVTVLRAGIIVGAGSASFEIIRDLVEKLPVMVAPKWLKTRCQPIGISNVVQFLFKVMLREDTFNKDFDIGGPDILTYREMLLQYAEVRKLKRYIFTVPIMTPNLSSFWLYFITSVSFNLARNLVDSIKIDVVCRPNNLAEALDINLMTYKESVAHAFKCIEQNMVVSSWKDAFAQFQTSPKLLDYIDIPKQGCFIDRKIRPLHNNEEQVLEKIWRIGGETGWYFGDRLWKFRGYLDSLAGGVGQRRGRTNQSHLHPGDSLDSWRVLLSDKEHKRLLLISEMKLPGEAWLEFKIVCENGQKELWQTATFRPHGVIGRLYWYAISPLHYIIFNGMIEKLAED